MYDEPDVVKMLREEEKLGKLQDSLQGLSEELEIEEKSSENAPGDSVFIFKEDVEKTNEKDFTIIRELKKEKRKSGISVVGDVPWGTHLCQFYKTKEDLLDILVPYFKAGLDNNEFCMWVTSEPLNVEEAKTALGKVVKDLDDYINKGQLEILDYSEWYTKNGKFNSGRVLEGRVEKEKYALQNGYDGLRFTGNTFWFEKKDWNTLKEHERKINRVVGKYHMLAICSYSLEKCDSFELLNVISNHQFALIRRNGKWEIIESSERKRMEEALQQNEENFKALAENANDGILIGTGDGGWHVYANRRAVEITGYSIEELLKTCIKDLVSPGEFAKLIERYKKRLVGLEVPKPYETTLVKKDGINVSIEISPSKTIWQNQLADMVIFRDITERKKAEETLRLNEEKLRKVIDSSPNTITVSDLNGIIIDCNQAAADMHGFSTKEDIIGKNALEFFAPKDREKVMEHFKKTLESGSVKNVEYTLLKKDGSEFPAELSASVIQDSSGKPLSFVGITKDITERKQAEKKLQESEKKFKTIADVAKEGIIMMDSKGEVSYWNEAAEKIFGYTSEEILGKSLHMVLAPKRFHELYYKGFEKFKETGTGAAVGKTLELAGIKKDATEFPLELSLSSVMIQNQWHAVGIARDISERKRTEESLKGKIDELERYKKVTVNREMKMIELKKKITELEEKSMKR